MYNFKTPLSLCAALFLYCRYDEELGVVYMAARLAGGYVAVRRALNEVVTLVCTCSGFSDASSRRVPRSQCFFFLLVITDQKKGSVVCASFSSGFWFRTRNSCLVSVKTPVQNKKNNGSFQTKKKINVCLPPAGHRTLAGATP